MRKLKNKNTILKIAQNSEEIESTKFKRERERKNNEHR